MSKLLKIINNFPNQRVGIIGDFMLDHYVLGGVERLSPEAPIPVIEIRDEQFIPGGAGNTSLNCSALGAAVFAVGAIGADIPGEKIISGLSSAGINIAGLQRVQSPTIEKIRVVAQGQHITRLDREFPVILSRAEENNLFDYLNEQAKNWDVVIISDYAKGFLNEERAKFILQLCRKNKKLTIVDTKPKHFHFFKGAGVIKPNQKEAELIAGRKIKNKKDLLEVGNFLQKKSHADILLSRGALGMSTFEKNQVKHLLSRAKEALDVTGAGDTVVAAMALALASGANLRQAAEIANAAAGIVVSKPGTATVSLGELKTFADGVGL